MAWNRSGTYLATTSSEDTITIWRFCLKEEIIRLPKQIRSKHRLINNALKSKRNIGRHYRHPIETAYGSTFRQLSTFRQTLFLFSQITHISHKTLQLHVYVQIYTCMHRYIYSWIQRLENIVSYSLCNRFICDGQVQYKLEGKKRC